MSAAGEYKAAGNAALRAGQIPEAISNYTKAIDLDGSNHVYFSNRSAAYLKQGNGTNALKDANSCIDLNPQFAKGYSRKGAALHELKRYNDSIAAYDEGLEKFPSDAGLKKGLSDVTREKDRPPKMSMDNLSALLSSLQGGSEEEGMKNYENLFDPEQLALFKTAAEHMKKDMPDKAPKVVDSVDYAEVSKLPSNGRVYFVDICEKDAGDYSCHCGLVEKEIGSNGKHWDNPNNQSDGLSAMVGLSAFWEDPPNSGFDKNCDIMLSTVAKACRAPGEFAGMKPDGFPINRPSRPRKILLINQAYVSSLSKNIKKMGISEVGVADRKLSGSMKASFSFSKSSTEEKTVEAMFGLSGEEQLEPSNWKGNLERAVQTNDSDQIKNISNTHGPNQVKKFVDEELILFKAAKAGTPKACRALIKYSKAKVDGESLSEAKKKEICLRVSIPLIDITPLIVAVAEGNISVVRCLIRMGADFRRTDKNGLSVLHIAVKKGHPDVVEELVIAGADVKQKDSDGYSPIDWNDQLLKSKSPNQAAPCKLMANILHNTDRRNRCAACNANGPLKSCPCKLEWYCNNECQRKSWKKHKQEHIDEMEVLGI